MQTPTDSSCTSSNANGASGSLPAITVTQVEIIEIKLLQILQILSWPGSIWTDQYHLNARVEGRTNSRSLSDCQSLQATAITDLTAVKECMTDPTASACTDTYGSRFLAPPLNNPSFRVCVFAIHFQFQLQLTNRLGGKMWRHHMYHAYHRPWCCQRMFQG